LRPSNQDIGLGNRPTAGHVALLQLALIGSNEEAVSAEVMPRALQSVYARAMCDQADDDELMDAVLLELQLKIGVGEAA
jgi:hypothetical protein